MKSTRWIRCRRWQTAFIAATVWGAVWQTAFALGPHELLLLVNRNCFDSLTVANHYIALRGIPLSNVAYLDIPQPNDRVPLELTPDDFTRHIWDPAQQALTERGIGDHVLAWVFSAGFPVRVATDPPMSTQGLIMAGNKPPDSEAIEKGQFASPLFRGPAGPEAPSGPPLSLESLNAALGERMPVVSMTLAHTGQRGLSRAEAVRLLQRSAEADGTRPEGVVYFVVTDDVRSHAREWQYEGAIQELRSLGIPAIDTPLFPAEATDVLGILMGAANANPERVGAFLPGAMAEHLTSWAATFDRGAQTKATAWLKAGAYSSAGTVTEPMSIWTKFPAARFFAHYARGCTLLESHVQALASPVQTLLLGDPLTAPWKPDLDIHLQEVSGGPQKERAFRARLTPAETQADFLFFLNGNRISPLIREPGVRLDSIPPGRHTLRVVAYTRGPIRHQAFAEIDIEERVPDRTVRLTLLHETETIPASDPVRFRLETEGNPVRIRIYAQGRTIETLDETEAGDLAFDPSDLGAGPVVFHAVAEFPDGMTLPGRPVSVTIRDEGSEP